MLHEVTSGSVEPRHVVRPIRALGDCARSWDPRRQAALPPTAQVAVQQARCAARNIARELRGQDKQPFVYRHQGDLVSLGAGDGVGEIAGVKFSGLPAGGWRWAGPERALPRCRRKQCF